MPTARFTRLVGIPERTYRRWQAGPAAACWRRGRGRPPLRTLWRTPSSRPLMRGRRGVIARSPSSSASTQTVWTPRRCGPSSAMAGCWSRITLARRRDLAVARRAAFVVPPSGPNQVWQLDFTEYETIQGGTWRISGCADYWAKAELGWHMSMTRTTTTRSPRSNSRSTRPNDSATQTLLELLTDAKPGNLPDCRRLRQRPGIQG